MQVGLALLLVALAASVGTFRLAGFDALLSVHRALVRGGGGVAGLLLGLGLACRAGWVGPDAGWLVARVLFAASFAVIGGLTLGPTPPSMASGAGWLGLSRVAWFHIGLAPVLALVGWSTFRLAQ